MMAKGLPRPRVTYRGKEMVWPWVAQDYTDRMTSDFGPEDIDASRHSGTLIFPNCQICGEFCSEVGVLFAKIDSCDDLKSDGGFMHPRCAKIMAAHCPHVKVKPSKFNFYLVKGPLGDFLKLFVHGRGNIDLGKLEVYSEFSFELVDVKDL